MFSAVTSYHKTGDPKRQENRRSDGVKNRLSHIICCWGKVENSVDYHVISHDPGCRPHTIAEYTTCTTYAATIMIPAVLFSCLLASSTM